MSKFAVAYARTGVALGTLASMISVGGKAYAATFDNNGLAIKGSTDLNGSGTLNFKTFIQNLSNQVLGILLLLAGVAAIFYLIFSGFQYITSAGNPEKVKTARQGIINAVIGVVIIVSAFFIVRFAGLLGAGIQTAATPQ